MLIFKLCIYLSLRQQNNVDYMQVNWYFLQWKYLDSYDIHWNDVYDSIKS